ncbi:hypothetical protein PFICI_00020 [Pestalotiopsis fici W106-1]|uniref:GDP-mannose transporter n=1 Tax=Pestalotiopsis fici (strain W106-1 / CGMCC3.15140) TaxID=1229662 RepID=W3XL39_PESFW|nr:uncharacterized protein PFICI_00020 [Pestalotiopsis fici W106-1]ETS86192.1 hypothetical protein PFICI_00020 [Pestalotiopsis fici W106-1]
MAWLWGLEAPTRTTLFKLLVIVFGVSMASAGEINFSWIGILYSCGGLIFESIRVVLIQDLLSGKGVTMDPLVGLYYYAPISAVINLVVAWETEWESFHWSAVGRAGVAMLALNMFSAFFLNVASMMVVCTITFKIKRLILI